MRLPERQHSTQLSFWSSVLQTPFLMSGIVVKMGVQVAEGRSFINDEEGGSKKNRTPHRGLEPLAIRCPFVNNAPTTCVVIACG